MYRIDPVSNDIVISGFENGIADSPYHGITDMRNLNIVSVPGEASVNFSTSQISSGTISGSIISASGTVATFGSTVGTLENNVAVYFTSAGAFSGFTVSTATQPTPYWITNLGSTTFSILPAYPISGSTATAATITGSGTAATFVAYKVATAPSYLRGSSGGPTGLTGIQQFAQSLNVQQSGNYFTFGIDNIGQVWGNQVTTGTNIFWTYTGNNVQDSSGNSNASGNGLSYMRFSNGSTGSSLKWADYLFAFRNSQIDYMLVQTHGSGLPATGVWNYGWNPLTATTGNSNYLTVPAGTSGSHFALVPPDGRLYFCDGDNVQKLFQTNALTIFDPTSTASYTYTTFTLLPVDDIAQCLAPLGTNIIIGGQGNQGYLWNTTSNLVSGYIPISDNFISQIVTVNTNAYMFAGNKGRIYITNGSQAQLYKKMPDHISGSVETTYQWAGACTIRNQIYFSFKATKNDGTTNLTSYGGLWAIDVDTKSLRLNNQLSYGTYAGYASAMIPQVYNPGTSASVAPSPGQPGMFIGWFDGVSSSGIDTSSANPYSGTQPYVISDMIPVGTALQPVTPAQLEWKTSSPLVSGEKIELQVGTSATLTGFVSVGSTAIAAMSDIYSMPSQNLQWIMVKAILTSTSNSPSFCRLTEIRVKGALQAINRFSSLQ